MKLEEKRGKRKIGTGGSRLEGPAARGAPLAGCCSGAHSSTCAGQRPIICNTSTKNDGISIYFS
jgi:hypothetical protein